MLLAFGNSVGAFKMNKLFVKLSKYSFGVQQIEYLGHMVSGDG